MTLLAIGLTHHSAPLQLLDELSVDAKGAADLAADAVRSTSVTEAMVLSTCNRLEIVADVAAFHASSQDLADALAKAVGADRRDLLPHLHMTYGEQAARHLFEVAAGLDSLVVGEQQIVGQVRAALAAAQDSGTAARRLNAVTQAALHAAKRVHTETGIDRQGTSVVSVGLDLAAETIARPWPQVRALVVGAGAMSSLAVASLAQRGVADVTVVNRTAARANTLAESFGVRQGALSDIAVLAATADLVVTCTGSTDLLLRADELAAARSAAGANQPLVVLDLAMPHDSDPALAHLPMVSRCTIADLAGRPEAAASTADLVAARGILAQELAEHLQAEARRRMDPLVVSLRARAGQHVAAEADRIRLRLPHLEPADHDEIERALRRAVNALLHVPTVRVRELAAEPEGRRYADALHSLFDLPSDVMEALGAGDQPGAAAAEDQAADDEGWW
jgi:glutamyl-tRNA reductase